jgi:hypothetical protein
MTIVNGVLIVFALLMICAFWLTADRKVTDDQEQEVRERSAVPDRTCASNSGREFWLEVEGSCGSNRPA